MVQGWLTLSVPSTSGWSLLVFADRLRLFRYLPFSPVYIRVVVAGEAERRFQEDPSCTFSPVYIRVVVAGHYDVHGEVAEVAFSPVYIRVVVAGSLLLRAQRAQ